MNINVIETELPGVLILEPKVFGDQRGFFMETYHIEKYKALGVPNDFVQDNVSFSGKGALRGLHYQWPRPQAKLVQALTGEIYDLAVDIRKSSPTFGKSVGVVLSGENKRQLFIPEGFAHGFCVLSDTALFSYKCGDLYSPECESGVLWSDPDLGIDWPIREPLLSDKDRVFQKLKDIPRDRLPD